MAFHEFSMKWDDVLKCASKGIINNYNPSPEVLQAVDGSLNYLDKSNCVEFSNKNQSKSNQRCFRSRRRANSRRNNVFYNENKKKTKKFDPTIRRPSSILKPVNQTDSDKPSKSCKPEIPYPYEQYKLFPCGAELLAICRK